MGDQESEIREAIITTAVTDWLQDSNPFSDIVFKDGLLRDVTADFGDDVSENDVEYVWKLMTEEGYFRHRGKSRRITTKEIDEAEELGVETPMDSTVQEEILQELKQAERENVNKPEVTRSDLLEALAYDPETIDYNLFYCKSKGWADVQSFIERAPWRWAEITKFGRKRV
ncbi:hypothetical protein [Natrinema gari]|uniref:Uncharacterized protein n=1 Tax=Natrinema gari JCM 14663 TaxID=1230459 RepID=L9Z8H1_9EURY|nr:hypothetical protein [Natrinema gari]ELY82654.1 hypothetical protein C486_04498 [Natrinema gari JCM 14663]